MATILDLRIINRADGIWYEFTWAGGPEWREALRGVKQVPFEDREFDEERKVWRVRANAETALALSLTFENFWTAVEAIESQTSLFAEAT